MQQITPRAGDVGSMRGFDIDGDSMMAIQRDGAHFDSVSVPPSRQTIEEGRGTAVPAQYEEMLMQVEASQSEIYQQRSDAEMEIESNMQERMAIGQEFFEAEQAIFSADGE